MDHRHRQHDGMPAPADNTSRAQYEKHYTLFIRLPFARADFIDPPLVDWNASKDRALWGIISSNPRNSDLDWQGLARRFEVTLPFLLQQVAWLYQKQLSQVRAQLRNVDIGPARVNFESAATSSVVPPASAQGLHPTSRLNAPVLSRTPSTATITQSNVFSAGGRQHAFARFQATSSSTPQENSHSPAAVYRKSVAPRTWASPSVSSEDRSSSSNSSSDSDAGPSLAKSRTLRGPTRFQFAKRRVQRVPSADERDSESYDGEEEEDDGPVFFTATKPDARAMRDSSSQAEHNRVASTESPASPRSRMDNIQTQAVRRASGPLNTQDKYEPTRASPAPRALVRDGSDGTPSMGSSFSDLDGSTRTEASVTQSALEEALLSNMQRGRMASRVSTISQALKSKYL